MDLLIRSALLLVNLANPTPTVVYATASVVERSLDDATSTASVLEREVLETSQAATIDDVLPFAPGLSFLSGGTRGGQSMVQIRGGDPNFTRVLIDGVPVTDGTYQQGGIFNFEALPAVAVERVEVVRGPLSAFYGSTGLAGVIQVVTRRGMTPQRAEVELAAGNARERRAVLSLGGESFFVNLLGEGEDERVAEESYGMLHLQGRADRRLGRAELRLAGRLASWNADDYPDASGGPTLGSGELRRSESTEGGLGVSLTLDPRGSGSHNHAHRFEAAFYRHDRDRESPAVVPLVPESIEATRFTRLRVGWASSWATSREDGGDVVASLGVDVEREGGENDSLLRLPPFLGGDVLGDYALARTTPGLFTQVTARRGRLTAEVGLRADFPENRADQLSARLGVGYALTPGDASNGSTRLRASVGRSFKLPSFFALASPQVLGGNLGLRPEVMVGGDVGVEHRSADGRGNVSLTVFAQRFRDLVDFDFDRFIHVNRSEVDAAGVELTTAWRPRPAWTLAANLTWQEVEDRATDERLLQRPRLVGAARVAWRGAHLGVQGDVRVTGSIRDRQLPVPEREEIDGRTLVGFAAHWHVAARLRVALRLENILGERYETLIGFPGPGRAARLSARWELGAP